MSPDAAAPRPWHQRLGQSLRWRLVGLFVLLALATSAVFMGGMRAATAGGWRELVRPLLADYVDRVAADLGTPPDVDKARALTERLPISIRIDGPVVQWQSHPDRPGPAGRFDGPPRERGWWPLQRRTADGHRIRFGLGETHWDDRPRYVAAFTLAVLLLLTVVTYFTVQRLFRPLQDIAAGAQRYGAGDFATPIPQRSRDELGQLAQQVNAMAGGLQRMLQGQRELLLAISHELRSPLTRARLNAELVAEGPERDALLRDLAQMGQLITDLLESERLAAGGVALRREPVDVNALVREVVAQVQANHRGAEVTLVLDEAVGTLPLDRTRVALALRNLLENAWRHAGGASLPPQVSTRAEAGGLALTVRDHGPGVVEDQIASLGQAFWRPDAARSRERGGVGLGLYLVRRVAQSHGGDLVLANAMPGLAATLHLRA
ncbi:signal transduction histidine kinase [Burkholderiales bacterium JOSHI_001]|nr:signal transduction histidine kinase [Burkholderiales bacterium JOSHI_001]